MKWLALIGFLLLLTALVSVTLPALAGPLTAPSIQVAPTPAGPGQLVTVYGRDFCADADCSAVTISLDGQTLADDIRVNADGTFSFPFIASQIPNQYRVTARQTAADGSTLEAAYGLMIVGSDVPPGETTAPPQTLPPSTTAVGQTPSPSGPEASPTPAQTLSPEATGAATPASGSPGAATGTDDDSSSLPWLLAGGFVALALLLVLVVRSRLRSSRPSARH